MIEISNVKTWGFDGAIKGMRNPYNSWLNSDSYTTWDGVFIVGAKDLELCKKLIKAGPEHRKFLRMIHIQADINAPLYWWKQFDTYKIGTVANSQSTMHTITKKPFTLEDFSVNGGYVNTIENVIEVLNNLRRSYIYKKDPTSWRAIIQLLPCSYNQLRTVDFNYETLMTIYKQRKNHKLTEWKQFCDYIEKLPSMKVFLDEDN